MGTVVTKVRRYLVDRLGLVDEVLVMDDHSVTAPPRWPRRPAPGWSTRPMCWPTWPAAGQGRGALALAARGQGDIVVVRRRHHRLRIAFRRRPGRSPAHRPPGQLRQGLLRAAQAWAARRRPHHRAHGPPVLATLFPHLSTIVQPLSGEFGGRRCAAGAAAVRAGLRRDIGLLIDVAEAVGPAGIVQVDLGTRVHRNRPLDEQGPRR